MPRFEPVGDLISDLHNAIETENQVFIRYIDRNGNPSERNIAPLEIRGDGLYAADIEKMSLRLFKLNGIQEYQIIEATFIKEELQLI